MTHVGNSLTYQLVQIVPSIFNTCGGDLPGFEPDKPIKFRLQGLPKHLQEPSVASDAVNAGCQAHSFRPG